MEIKYNITGKERKEFVKTISGIIEMPSKYLGMPTCAYAIGDFYTVTKDGTLEIADNADVKETEHLIAALKERGYEPENTEQIELVILGVEEGDDTPECFSIGMPMSELSEQPFSEDALSRFRAVVENYEDLFKKALETSSALKTEIEDGSVWFDWFDRMLSQEELALYTDFIKALYRFAETTKRVNGKRGEIENEKFTMRTFLNRIGLSGMEYKPLRKLLLKNLSGNSAFRYCKPGATEGGDSHHA